MGEEPFGFSRREEVNGKVGTGCEPWITSTPDAFADAAGHAIGQRDDAERIEGTVFAPPGVVESEPGRDVRLLRFPAFPWFVAQSPPSLNAGPKWEGWISVESGRKRV